MGQEEALRSRVGLRWDGRDTRRAGDVRELSYLHEAGEVRWQLPVALFHCLHAADGGKKEEQLKRAGAGWGLSR